MQIEKLLSSNYVTEKQIGEEFYFVASSEDNSTLLKKLFIKMDYKDKLTSKVLTYGLLATLELDLQKNYTLIKQFMDKNNISVDSDILTNGLTHPLEGKEQSSFDSISKFMIDNHIKPDRTRMVDYALNLLQSDNSINPIMEFWDKTGVLDTDLPYLQTIYNFAVDHKKTIITAVLDKHFDIIKNSLKEELGEDITFMDGAHSSWGSLKADGRLSMCGAMGGPLEDNLQRRIDYQVNPILLNLKHFNIDKLDSFFKKSLNISSSLVLHAVVRSVVFNNDNAVKYLFSQPQCVEVIKNSNEIQNFITCTDISDFGPQFEENKQLARKFLEQLLNNNDVKSKLKP